MINGMGFEEYSSLIDKFQLLLHEIESWWRLSCIGKLFKIIWKAKIPSSNVLVLFWKMILNRIKTKDETCEASYCCVKFLSIMWRGLKINFLYIILVVNLFIMFGKIAIHDILYSLFINHLRWHL